VLVVDDDPDIRELLFTALEDEGFEVVPAGNGQEALAIIKTFRPDVIVLDLMMPDVNGFDVVDALKEHPGTASIPILVVTSKQVTAEDRAKLRGSVAAIMEKAEFDQGRFTAEVKRAMSRRPVVA
jgi:CheY-like chemotaxis protein